MKSFKYLWRIFVYYIQIQTLNLEKAVLPPFWLKVNRTALKVILENVRIQIILIQMPASQEAPHQPAPRGDLTRCILAEIFVNNQVMWVYFVDFIFKKHLYKQ